MRVGVSAGALGPAEVDFVTEAERLGADAVWTAEFWAGDALTPLAYLAARTSAVRLGTAIAQLGARTPAMLAMSAMSMQALSGGRFVLGVGTSGPQVMEGWHGVRFDQPVRRTRETIEILRRVTCGEPLTHEGRIYTLPLPGGEGRPIRSAMPAVHVPVYVAALGPANLRLTGELADGWIGNSFFPENADVFFDPIRAGAAAAGRDFAELDLTVAVGVEFTDAVEEAGRRHAAGYAFTFGAMGSLSTNFYNDAFARQGFADDVRAVQQLWLSGRRDAARNRVPIQIGLGTNLIGTDDMILERLRLYCDAGVTGLRASFNGEDPHRRLDDLAHLLDLARQVDAEAPGGEEHGVAEDPRRQA
jgi:F420-dependent oxidoreductase-like protein